MAWQGNHGWRRSCYETALKLTLEKMRKGAMGLAKPNLHTTLGIAYAGLGRKQDAIREGKAGADSVSLARIYTMVGEYDEAIRLLETAMSRDIWESVTCGWIPPGSRCATSLNSRLCYENTAAEMPRISRIKFVKFVATNQSIQSLGSLREVSFATARSQSSAAPRCRPVIFDVMISDISFALSTSTKS